MTLFVQEAKIKSEIRGIVRENVQQYENTLAYFWLCPDLLYPGQCERDKEVVAFGLDMSGIEKGTINSLLAHNESLAAADAAFHCHLTYCGAQRTKLSVTNEAKDLYFKGKKQEALKLVQDIGYKGTDGDFFWLMNDIMQIGKEFRGSLDKAVDEIFDLQCGGLARKN